MKRKIFLAVMACIVLTLSGCKSSDYRKAAQLMNDGNYDHAAIIFEELGDFKDSADMLTECKYGSAVSLYDSGDFKTAYEKFRLLGNYEDSEKYAKRSMWEIIYEKYPYTENLTESVVSKIPASKEGDFNFALSVTSTQEKDELDIRMFATDLSNTTLITNMIIHEEKDDISVISIFDSEVSGEKIDIIGAASLTPDQYYENYEPDWKITIDDSIPGLHDTLEDSFNASLDTVMVTLKEEFNKNGLGFTLADIGFTNY